MKKSLFPFFVLISFYSYGQTQFKILTYNIYHGELAYEKGKPNLDSVASLVNRMQPDFVVCQEVDSQTNRIEGIYNKKTDYIKALAGKTGMHGYFGKAMNYDGGGYGEGILSKSPLDIKLAILPTPSGGEPRALIYSETKLQNGQKIIIGGTHLCHQFEKNRMAQVKYMDSLFQRLPYPTIVCGDFNFESNEAPYSYLMKSWKDAAKESNSVFNTFSFDNPTIRIDYAFYHQKGRLKIIKTEIIPVSYSDHLPVLFTFEYTGPE